MLRSVSHVNPRADSPHVPVLHREVVAWLDLEPGMTVVDGTFGAGGHARVLADAMDGRGCYVAIDRDPGVKGHFAAFAHDHPDLRTRFVRGNFSLALRNLAATGVKADAVLLDLGISSMQIDQTDRGFAYATDAPLDMRMDPADPRTAADLVNELDERTLARIIHKYGEERYASQIARAIVRRRAQEPFSRSGDLVETVRRAIPTPAQFGAGHPAKRVFQALRIVVNDELGALEDGLDHALEMLRPGGRLAVISFHSLEDRIVKTFMRDAARGCICPPDLPICGCGNEPLLRVLTPRVVRPNEIEVEDNPRAASARLRVAERTSAELPA
jgi:16S rRNA (cytosine1402-N4)-methyltransferase